MAQEHIQTRRLSLEPLSSQHKDALQELDADADVMRYIFTGNPLTTEESSMVFNHLQSIPDSSNGLGCWVGFDGNEFVGWWVVAPSEQPAQGQDADERRESNASTSSTSSTNRIEVGMRVAPKFWGKGYAQEGLNAMIQYTLGDFGAEEVYGETMAVNAGSRATMAKCGLKHVRTWHNNYEEFTPAAGIEEGEVEYRLTRDEWLARRPSMSTE
jgi:RimJ/RimL family protein N-acetyltransferase